VISKTRKRFWETPNEALSWETWNLIIEKDGDKPEKDK
jgi:hypothetical protein